MICVSVFGRFNHSHLDVLALDLVVEHVCHVLVGNLFAPRSRVDAHHGDADGPGRVADRHLQVGIVCAQVVAIQQVLHHLHETVQDGAVGVLSTKEGKIYAFLWNPSKLQVCQKKKSDSRHGRMYVGEEESTFSSCCMVYVVASSSFSPLHRHQIFPPNTDGTCQKAFGGEFPILFCV